MSIILRENENLVKVVHEHPMVLIQTFLIWPLLIVALVLVRYLAKFNFFGYWSFVIVVAALIVAIIVFYKYFIWNVNALVITDQRVIENKQHGFFAKTVTELLYHDILEISYTKEGMSSAVYNYGDLRIRTASDNQLVFERIPDPDHIVGLINNLRQEKRSEF